MRVCVVGCGAVGSLFAAHLATLPDVEVWAYDVVEEHVAAINADGLRLTGRADILPRLRRVPTPPRSPVRLRDRRDEIDVHRAGDRAPRRTCSATAPSAASRTGSATRR